MEGENHPLDTEVIEYPENYKEMVQKHLEREQEQLEKVLASRKAKSVQELADIGSKAIVTRARRASQENKALKDRTIIRDAKSEDILDLKNKLSEEINTIGQRILQELPSQLPSLEKKVIGLKGRISQAKGESKPE